MAANEPLRSRSPSLVSNPASKRRGNRWQPSGSTTPRASQPVKILIVDAEHDGVRLQMFLRSEGYRAALVSTCSEALATMTASCPDLVILDLRLPDGCGFELIESLKDSVPVLVLTAEAQELNAVTALNLGADDFLDKTAFGARELVARAHAILRRYSRPKAPRPRNEGLPRIGEVEVDLPKQALRRNGRVFRLTRQEGELLAVLLEREGEVVSRLELLKKAWGHKGPVSSRTVDTHVASLRSKLGGGPDVRRYLVTVHGRGYMLHLTPPDVGQGGVGSG